MRISDWSSDVCSSDLLAADGRITVMFCAFDRSALILRIYGRGRPVLPQDDEWDALAAHFTLLPGTRQLFVLDVDSVQTSCGWGVPTLDLQHERSEERRVGKECVSTFKSRWSPDHSKKKT